jgi:hypothetical protein
MIWEIRAPGGRAIFMSRTRSIAVRSATSISMPTWTIWPCRSATIRTACWHWPSGWSSKTACRTGRPRGTYGGTTGYLFPLRPCRTGWRRGGKKAEAYVADDYLNEALAGFSGYIAADELYDGPYCVLSLVDNRAFTRLMYEVLDHDPQHEDIRRFLRRFREKLDARGLKVRAVTTDASPLYPGPLAEVFGSVAHQVCQFHVIAELTKAVLKAVAKTRKALKARMPVVARGRPGTPAQRRAAQRKKRLQKQVTALFEHRHLFVKHHRSASEKRALIRVSRGQPPLRALRAIMEEVYRLFDRRCRTETALSKLAQLRRRVRPFKSLGKTLQKIFSPNLEKALTFLDDALLPATSNAVERGNRRHRKMQKTVYRVRTQERIRGRIALDMQRDAQGEARAHTMGILHQVRAAAS